MRKLCIFCTYLEDCAQLRIFCTYLEDCALTAHILHMYTSRAHFAHVPNILLTAHILHICRMWFTSAQMSAAQKQIAYIMYAAHVPDFCKGAYCISNEGHTVRAQEYNVANFIRKKNKVLLYRKPQQGPKKIQGRG